MNKMLQRWLESIGTVILGAAILKCWPLFLSGYQQLQQLGLLTLALLVIDLLLFLVVIAFDIYSFLKSCREKHKFIKRRFGFLWKFEGRSPDKMEPEAHCPKHKISMIVISADIDEEDMNISPPILSWYCNECKKSYKPKERGKEIGGADAIFRMKQWFNRI